MDGKAGTSCSSFTKVMEQSQWWMSCGNSPGYNSEKANVCITISIMLKGGWLDQCMLAGHFQSPSSFWWSWMGFLINLYNLWYKRVLSLPSALLSYQYNWITMKIQYPNETPVMVSSQRWKSVSRLRSISHSRSPHHLLWQLSLILKQVFSIFVTLKRTILRETADSKEKHFRKSVSEWRILKRHRTCVKLKTENQTVLNTLSSTLCFENYAWTQPKLTLIIMWRL